jgi:uncharacterized integral membrane protein|tara:strand:- start:14976 stop:15275 length:300 start_codon:yes stop_codon:yes gene_type:complete
MVLLKKLLWLLVALAAVWLGIWVVFDNPEPVAFRLFGFDLGLLPGGLLLLAAFAIGCITGLIVSIPALVRLGHRANVLKKQLIKSKAPAIDGRSPEKLD